MKAALVVEAGRPPIFGDFKDPAPTDGKSLIRVTAAALTHVTRQRAAGTHYSSEGEVPFVPGVDGVGTDERGRRVYFAFPDKPYGAMGQLTLVDSRQLLALPDGLSDEAAAAMANPGMSSWAALNERAHLRPGETVLINGAAGVSGRLAIQIAKHLGAKRVIATGRETTAFDELRRLGADATVTLVEDGNLLEKAFQPQFAQGVDVVLDYLWGPTAEAMIKAAAVASPASLPVRFVQIGALAGQSIALPGAALRSSGLQLLGSGFGSVPLPKLLAAIQAVLEAAPTAGFQVRARSVPLADVGQAWAAIDSSARLVLRP